MGKIDMRTDDYLRSMDRKIEILKTGRDVAEAGGTALDWANRVGCSQPYLLQTFLPYMPELTKLFESNRKTLPSQTGYWAQVHRLKLLCGIEYGLWSYALVANVLGISRAALTQYRTRYCPRGALFSLAEITSAEEIDAFVRVLHRLCNAKVQSPMESHANRSRLARNSPAVLRKPKTAHMTPPKLRFETPDNRRSAILTALHTEYNLILTGRGISDAAFRRHRLGIKHAARARNESRPDVGSSATEESLSDVGSKQE